MSLSLLKPVYFGGTRHLFVGSWLRGDILVFFWSSYGVCPFGGVGCLVSCSFLVGRRFIL